MDDLIDHRFETETVTATLVVMAHERDADCLVAALDAKSYTVVRAGPVRPHEVCVLCRRDDYLGALDANPAVDYVVTDDCTAFRYLLDYARPGCHVQFAGAIRKGADDDRRP